MSAKELREQRNKFDKMTLEELQAWQADFERQHPELLAMTKLSPEEEARIKAEVDQAIKDGRSEELIAAQTKEIEDSRRRHDEFIDRLQAQEKADAEKAASDRAFFAAHEQQEKAARQAKKKYAGGGFILFLGVVLCVFGQLYLGLPLLVVGAVLSLVGAIREGKQ